MVTVSEFLDQIDYSTAKDHIGIMIAYPTPEGYKAKSYYFGIITSKDNKTIAGIIKDAFPDRALLNRELVPSRHGNAYEIFDLGNPYTTTYYFVVK